MTQVSRFWDGTTVGDATAAPYDAASETARVLQSVSGGGGIATNQGGVFRGELNELAVTGASTPVSINSGRGISAGNWFENDAAVTVAIPTPAASTRVDVIVMRKDWVAQTVRITRVAGVEGAGVPAIMQIYGTTWDTPLANASITTGGVITVTDRRQFVGSSLLTNVQSMAVGDVLYADTTTTLARLAIGPAGSFLNSHGGIPRWGNTIEAGGINVTGDSVLVGTNTTGGHTIRGGPNSAGSGAYLSILGSANGGLAGGLILYTPNAAANADVERLRISGTATTAAVTWATVTHDFGSGTAVFGGGVATTGNSSYSASLSVGTISTANRLYVLSADNTGATNIAAFWSNNATLGVGIGYDSIRALSTGTNSDLSINGKGTGTIRVGDVSTGGLLMASGKLVTAGSGTGGAGFNLPHGTAPTSPVNGDMWSTTAGLFVRINGVTKTVTLT